MNSPLSFEKEGGLVSPLLAKTLEKDSSRLGKMTKAELVTARLHPERKLYH
jgi:hypothetical protein